MFMGYDLQSSKEWACQEERKDDLLMHTPIFTVFSLSLLPLSFSFFFLSLSSFTLSFLLFSHRGFLFLHLWLPLPFIVN